MNHDTHWPIFTANSEPHDNIEKRPKPPSWRDFNGQVPKGYRHAHELESEAIEQGEHKLPPRRKTKFEASPEEIELINAAIYLRRPLLVTGKPGIGKSTLAYAIAHELKLGPVLLWAINSRSTLQDALYRYDAIGRMQEVRFQEQERHHEYTQNKSSVSAFGSLSSRLNLFSEPDKKIQSPSEISETVDIGEFIRLGPLGTALLPVRRPRVLLIDEIDKSDIDLPNDLLNTFEEGSFEIQELVRLNTNQDAESQSSNEVHTDDGLTKAEIIGGRVTCNAFPIVILTSNGEREFPAPFLRRCIRLEIKPPDPKKLDRIVKAHFGKIDEVQEAQYKELIDEFMNRRSAGNLATDQLLNAIYLSGLNVLKLTENEQKSDKDQLIDHILRQLTV